MCLITKKKKVSIAKRDKTVIKWIRRDYFFDDNPNIWSGPIYNNEIFPYNEIVIAKDFHGKEIDHLQICGGCIDEGIHSYRIYSLRYLDDTVDHCICVIPKGSEYCYGMGGEVVSKEIIVFSSYKEYFKYRWKKLLKLFR